MLAIEAQGEKITTIEGLTEGEALTPVMQAFVDHDAQQCGFCTPGFVVATTHFLENHPLPTQPKTTSARLERATSAAAEPTMEFALSLSSKVQTAVLPEDSGKSNGRMRGS